MSAEGIYNATGGGDASTVHHTAHSSEQNMSQINREFQEKSTLEKARSLGLPYLDLGKTPLNPDFLKLVDYELAKSARIIPFFKVGKKVRVAVDDINNPLANKVIEGLKAQGFEIDITLVSPSGVDDALSVYFNTQKYKEISLVESVEQKAIKTYEKEIAILSDLGEKIETVTAEQALNLINVGAMKTSASDIHYEPEEGLVVVRFRIDGMLHAVFKIRPEVYKNLANQIKYESGMQLNVDNIPQDGRYTFNFNETKVGVRVSSIPTPFGSSFVCRFLVGGSKSLEFEDLGFQGSSLKKLEQAANISQGMILVTGPTGSGKSTTLYSLLAKMNKPYNKAITLEDPVEYPIKGVTQSQINEKENYDFASGLRAILRQDPDIIMIGEIRDLETAETAAQAALTGHVLLSTLHTNSALESIPRLINMGLKSFMVAPSLNTVLAQRLIRKVCPNCYTLEDLSDIEKKAFEDVFTLMQSEGIEVDVPVPTKIPKSHGCEACSSTGYRGRAVINEVITLSVEMKDLILREAGMTELTDLARKEGMITLREDGFLKVAQGWTTLEEVYRVTNIFI